MSAPTPDLPAVTLTDEERERLCICDYLVDGKHAGLCDDVRVETERILAARLAAQPVGPAPDRDALAEALRDVFRGDEYEENAAAAADEGEWSWFAWLAATAGVDAVLAALAARPAPSGDADLAARVQAAQAEVANAFLAWANQNEIAEPPLNWAWFGEIVRRYSPLHEEHEGDHRALLSDQPATTPEGIEALIERSSLGTPEVKAARASVSDEHAARAVARARALEEEDAPPAAVVVCGDTEDYARAYNEGYADAEKHARGEFDRAGVEPQANREDGMCLLPDYSEDDFEPIPGSWSAGWAISFGCQVSFGPSPDGELRAVVSVSDRTQREGIARRAVTPAQLREFAGFLAHVADDQDAATPEGAENDR